MSNDADIGTLPAWPELPEGRPRTTLDLAAAKLRAAIQETPGFVLVTADNARVSEALFLRIEPELQVFRTVRVSGRNLDPDAVLKKLWKKVEPTTNPPRAAVRLLIDRARATGHPIVVALADADDADPAQLEKLRVLLEGAPDASEIVRIVLLGGPGLVELLRKDEARAVAIRIGASVNVPTATSALVNAAVIVEAPKERRLSIGGVVAVATIAGVTLLVAMAGVVAWMSTRPAIDHMPANVVAQIKEAKPPAASTPQPTLPVAPAPPAPVAQAAPAPPPPAPVAQAAPAAQPTAEALPPAAPVGVPPADWIPSAKVEPPEPQVGLPDPGAAAVAKVEPSPAAAVAKVEPSPPAAKEEPPPVAKEEAPQPAAAPVAKLATPEPDAPVVLLDQALQVGAFLARERAEAVRRQLEGRFPNVTIKPMARDGQTLYRVRVGGFRSEQDLGLAAAALRTDGWQPMRVRP